MATMFQALLWVPGILWWIRQGKNNLLTPLELSFLWGGATEGTENNVNIYIKHIYITI